MSSPQILVQFFKVLAEENRLRIIGLLSEREYSVKELAGVLALTEPTTSHHLSRLREVGLVNLRMQGNQRFYRTSEGTLRRLKGYVGDLETIAAAAPDEVADDAIWIEALEGFDEWERKVLKDYTFDGRFKQLPAKLKKFRVLVKFLAREFETGRDYTEQEVNAVIAAYFPDYATLRRALVDDGFLARSGGGRVYWKVEG